jgi:hypothetical protein
MKKSKGRKLIALLPTGGKTDEEIAKLVDEFGRQAEKKGIFKKKSRLQSALKKFGFNL